MQINTNMNSIVASSALAAANKDSALAMQRISTTSRLNSASDDPAGIVSSTRFKTQIMSLTKANQNINSGMGALQVMDSTLGQVSTLLTNMKALAISSSSATSSTDDQKANDSAFQSYLTQITSLSTAAKWNGTALLSAAATFNVRTGAAVADTVAINTYDTTAATLSVAGNVLTSSAADTAQGVLDTAIITVSGYQAKVGANMNLLDTRTNLNDSLISANNSGYVSITNADLATETANLASAQIRQNAAAAMFAQSNTISKEIVGYLLKGL
jgi:flagellin